ncbi:TA system toxin CbtA family protein [Yersinia enterocolitica]|nr:toxin [Yersinia enterocolitica]
MQTLPVSPTRDAQPCLSPVALNDTLFHYESVIQEHIESGISLKDAVNLVVEHYGLLRIDRRSFSFTEQCPFMTCVNILQARRATGLLKREGYKAVSIVIHGKGPRRGRTDEDTR